MHAAILFIIGLLFIATGRRSLVIAGAAVLVLAATLISIGVLMWMLPYFLLVVFPLALAYALFKVLR